MSSALTISIRRLPGLAGLPLPGGSVAALAVPVLHRAVGAALLGAAVTLLLGLLRTEAAAVGPPPARRAPAMSLGLGTGS